MSETPTIRLTHEAVLRMYGVHPMALVNDLAADWLTLSAENARLRGEVEEVGREALGNILMYSEQRQRTTEALALARDIVSALRGIAVGGDEMAATLAEHYGPRLAALDAQGGR